MMSDHDEIQVKGKKVRVRGAHVHGRSVVITGKWLRTAVVKDEELVEGHLVDDPEAFVAALKAAGLRADVFTFAQKLGDTAPRYRYHHEWDNPAVIPIATFAEWWNDRAESSVRRAVRKAAKEGVVVRTAELDDAFVRGIAAIYDETPTRQGRSFWHYGKDVDSVRRENGTYPERSVFLGAYYEDELIGFMKLIMVDDTASIIQILAKMKHFDKRPSNALIAKAVELCEERRLAHLVYCSYVYNDPKSSLTEFKRRNGFEQQLVPRYYIPLTLRGRVALQFRLHQGVAKRIPRGLLVQLLRLRGLWYARRWQPVRQAS
jgi:hypothetical protein